MSTAKKPLIIVSYYEPGTGFYRIIQNIASQLSDTFDIHYIGIGYRQLPQREEHWTLYPGSSGNRDYGASSCIDCASRLDPGHILLINDLWVISHYKNRLSKLNPDWTINAYVPIDGYIPHFSMLSDLTFLDTLILYTHFAKLEVERHRDLIGREKGSLQFPKITVIPHGTDDKFFRLFSTQRKEIRKFLFASDASWWNAFIVLNANRFSPRKRLDLTLDAFSRFSEGRDDVRLYLHQALINEREYEALNGLIRRYGLENIARASVPNSKLCSEVDLNQIYNACDVGINTSLGEGWGLISFEHAATGAAQVVPSHSVGAELWRGAAEFAAVSRTYRLRKSNNMVQSEIDPVSASNALTRLYDDRNHLGAVARNCFELATSEQYSWKNIGRQWKLVFKH